MARLYRSCLPYCLGDTTVQSFIVTCSVAVTVQFTWSRHCLTPCAQPVEVRTLGRTFKFKMHFLIMIHYSIFTREVWNTLWINPKKKSLFGGEQTVLNTCIFVNDLQKYVANEEIGLVLNLTRKKVQLKKINI